MGACCGKEQIEYTSESYYAPTSWDFFEEKFVAFGAETDEAALKFRNVVSWIPAEPKAIVLLCHGLHEHSLRYHKLAHALTARRFVVYGIDHIGHGKSSGPRALIPDFHGLVKDFSSFAAYVRRLHPSLPLCIVAHSMGTLVTTLALESIPDVTAVVFSGAALFAGEASASPFGCQCLYPVVNTSCGMGLSRMLASVDPRGPSAPIFQSALTSDPDEILIIKKDPFFYDGDVLNRTAYEVLQMIKVCRDEKIQTLTVPFLALHGAEDRVTLVKGSHYLMEKSATPAEDKELIVMPGLKHDIFHEKQPDGNECIKTVVNYLDKCFDARENPQPKPQTQAQTAAPADKGDMNGKGEARGGNEEVEEEKETDKKKEKKEVFEM